MPIDKSAAASQSLSEGSFEKRPSSNCPNMGDRISKGGMETSGCCPGPWKVRQQSRLLQESCNAGNPIVSSSSKCLPAKMPTACTTACLTRTTSTALPSTFLCLNFMRLKQAKAACPLRIYGQRSHFKAHTLHTSCAAMEEWSWISYLPSCLPLMRNKERWKHDRMLHAYKYRGMTSIYM